MTFSTSLQSNLEESQALRLQAVVSRGLLEGTTEWVRMRRSVTHHCTQQRIAVHCHTRVTHQTQQRQHSKTTSPHPLTPHFKSEQAYSFAQHILSPWPTFTFLPAHCSVQELAGSSISYRKTQSEKFCVHTNIKEHDEKCIYKRSTLKYKNMFSLQISN